MIKIRGFRRDDLEALYAISLATGHEGRDASHLYKDGKLIGQIYSAPYALLEPGLALVIEDQEGVAGFAVGTKDTNQWLERLEIEWWPALRQTYADPSGRPRADWSADERRAFSFHHPQRPPAAVLERYPAHMHLNLLDRLRRRGVGTKLFLQWLALASQSGAKPVHVGVNAANERAVNFWSKQGFERLKLGDEASTTIWMGR